MLLFPSVVDNAINGAQKLSVDSGVELLVGLVGFREFVCWCLRLFRRYWWMVAYLKDVRLVIVNSGEGSSSWTEF